MQVKAKLPGENADIWWLQSSSKLLLFSKFFSYLVRVTDFQYINSSFLSRRKYDGNSFTPTPCKPFLVIWILYFCLSFYKVTGNEGFISYNRYNVLRKAIKTVHQETSTNTYICNDVTN